MKRQLLLITFLGWFCFIGCSQKIPLKNDFWQQKKTSKIGVAVQNYPKCGAHRRGGEGLIDIAINNAVTNQFDKDLSNLDVSSFDKSKSLFSNKLKSVQFNVKEIASPISIDDYEKFNTSQQGSNKFFKKDLRSISEKEKIDYLILLSVEQCGTLRKYYGFIPLGRPDAFFKVTGQLIDLKTNEILWRTDFKEEDSIATINGSWDTPPDYPELKQALNSIISIYQNEVVNDFFQYQTESSI